LHDVAAEAGVSVSAVSKVIRNSTGVSAQMRERVETAIEKLSYRPHAGARAMRGSTYTIGVVMNELTSPFQPEVAQAIGDGLEGTQYQGILVAAGSDAQRQQRAIESLLDRQVDGLVLIAPFTSTEWLEQLASSIPTVVIARHGASANYDTVVDDDFEGARMLVDHLVGLGHTKIAHTGHPSGGLKPPSVLSQTARRDGYEKTMKKHGLDPDVIVTTYSEEGGYAAALQALNRPSPPTAIFAGADIAALGVLRAAEELGLRVPEDLSVAGYDDIYVSKIGRVSLTTVDQSGHLTGTTSARLLVECIRGRTQSVHYVIAPRLVVRSTTAGPPAGKALAGSRRPRLREVESPAGRTSID
jgi:LacI family transcriptional regulator